MVDTLSAMGLSYLFPGTGSRGPVRTGPVMMVLDYGTTWLNGQKGEQSMTEEKQELTDKPLDKMTVTELREIAKEIPEITGVHGMKKPELLAAVKQARGIADEPRKKSGPPKVKVAVPKAAIKSMIRDLKTQRRRALEEKDKQMAERYRRKISRLKKKSRQAA
jgi:hypothetical protein